MMKKFQTPRKWMLLAALVCMAGLTSCGDKGKDGQSGDAGNGAKSENAAKPIPEDAYRYTTKDQAAHTPMTVEKLSFSDKVLTVVEHEFENNTNIKELYLPKGFSHVAQYGFAGCTNLEKLQIDGTVDVINDNAFEGCKKIKSVEGDVRSIGLSTFKGCESIEKVHLTGSLYWIREGAFAGCKNLKSLLMSISITKLEDGAFTGCDNIEEASVPNEYRRHMFNVYKDMKNIKKVYLLVMEVYPFPENSKDFPCEQVDLYVPDNMVEAYKADKSWSRFHSILPLSQTEYYTAEGWDK